MKGHQRSLHIVLVGEPDLRVSTTVSPIVNYCQRMIDCLATLYRNAVDDAA